MEGGFSYVHDDLKNGTTEELLLHKKGDFPQSFHTEADGVNKQSLESWEIVLADEGEKRRRGKEKIPISMSHHMGF